MRSRPTLKIYDWKNRKEYISIEQLYRKELDGNRILTLEIYKRP